MIIMRDKRFIAIHRGGLLSKEHHRLLMKWAHDCAKHVLPLLGDEIDERLIYALRIALAWVRGEVSVGDARNASVNDHAAARASDNPLPIAVARACGHAVATAHMADHSLGAAIYALIAVNRAGKSIEAERNWQNEQLPDEIRELVLTTRGIKEEGFRELRIKN
jgi:hypothetical protein